MEERQLGFADVKIRQDGGDHSALPYIHILMCGLKAWSTQTAADGVEEARKKFGAKGKEWAEHGVLLEIFRHRAVKLALEAHELC
jgi:hypothetical protein